MGLRAGEWGSILPAVWQVDPERPAFEQHVFVGWLEVQVPRRPCKVDSLTRWRNREVFEWVRSVDWTLSMFDRDT